MNLKICFMLLVIFSLFLPINEAVEMSQDGWSELNTYLRDDTHSGDGNGGMGYRDISGDWDSWYRPGLYDRSYSVTQNGRNVEVSESDGTSFSGFFIDFNTVTVNTWDEEGRISGNGKRIDWNNTGFWKRI